jgi:hypothetical protein
VYHDGCARRIVITCLGSYGDVFPYIGWRARSRLAGTSRSSRRRPAIARRRAGRDRVRTLGPDVDLRDEAALARVMDARAGR